MDIDPDAVINGLLDEIKRLTLEMVALRAMLIKANHGASESLADEVQS